MRVKDFSYLISFSNVENHYIYIVCNKRGNIAFLVIHDTCKTRQDLADVLHTV